ncbi:MAG: OadG-related small transporter subunit [Eubacteriales bacterium]|nr:OadG-related small transporter subunit [Eubacteriales bacterium]
MTEFMLGIDLMLYGLGGTFLSLILFYLLIKAMVGIAKRGGK